MSCFHRGDTLKILQTRIPSKSVNLIYIDPPFGTTSNKWDEKQDWPKLFTEFFRVLKDDGMIVIHCSIPFNYELIRAAPKPPLYSWYWKKESVTCPLLANHQPLRCMEEILVWKKKKTTYYRQQIGNELRESKTMTPTSYYKPAFPSEKTLLRGKTRTHFLEVKRNIDGYSTRPEEILRLMVNSYSKQGDTVLDCFCYKGVSRSACQGRRWIGIDKYFIPPHMF